MQKTLLFKYHLPKPLEKERAIFTALENELGRNILPSVPEEKNEELSINIIKKTFEKYGLKLKYCGYYEVDSNNPERTNPRPFNIGKGCAGIPIYKGVIGKAIRNFAESVYVPDVRALEMLNPLGHVACDPTMAGAEIVIALPYVNGELLDEEKRMTRMTLDLDIERKNPFSDQGAIKLEEVCLTYMKMIFPGPPKYLGIAGIHMPKKLELQEH